MSSGLHYFWWKVQIILIVHIYMYTIFTISFLFFKKIFSFIFEFYQFDYTEPRYGFPCV